MRFFLQHMRANRDGMLIMLGIQGGLFLLGVLIVLGINAGLNDERDYAAIGSMMALMGTAFGSLARGHGAPVRYRMAVSMGCTRRSYLLADPLVTALNTLAGVGTAWVLNKLELWFYSVLYRGWELNFEIFTVLAWWTAEWWVWIVFIGGVCAVDFCLGASAEMGDVPEAGQLVARPLEVTAHDLAAPLENYLSSCPGPLPIGHQPGIAWHTLSGSGLDPYDFSAASATYPFRHSLSLQSSSAPSGAGGVAPLTPPGRRPIAPGT